MAVFRIEKTKDYTIMSNHHLRNKSLSLKAKGLQSLMLSLPESWDFTLAGLAYICQDGIGSVRSGVTELEEQGYLTRRRIREANGQLSDIEYTIHEIPHKPEPADSGDPDGEPVDNSPPVCKKPTSQKPICENPTLVDLTYGNDTQLSNTSNSLLKKSNTDLSTIHQSIGADAPDRTDGMEAMEIYRNILKENIEYDHLCETHRHSRDEIEELLELMHSSYVCTDPKGTILVECGKLLKDNGYKIKVLNTIDFKKSHRYNPFAYIRSEKDILKFVTALISNTKGDQKGGDEFWTKAETLLYQALIGYIWYEAPPKEKNMNTLVEMINNMEVREDDETFKNSVDFLFEALEERAPNHFALRQYKKYKLAAGKTAKSILISCGARLSPFDIAEVREMMSEDELELDKIGGYKKFNPKTKKDEVINEKTAFFVIISDTDDSFNFIVALMYSQLFNLMCDRADNEFNGRLPVPTRIILDEFANIGLIPKFEKLIATIRSREISACIILQAQSQLKAIYKDNMDTILGNCDAMLFLGGKEKTTLEEISKMLGRETIDMYNTSVTKGTQESHGQNFQKLGKELMSVDEIAVMDGGRCILQLRGERPFLSRKYDIMQHKNYRYLSDANPKNAFDIGKFLSTKLILKPDDEYEVIEIDLSDEPEPQPAV